MGFFDTLFGKFKKEKDCEVFATKLILQSPNQAKISNELNDEDGPIEHLKKFYAIVPDCVIAPEQALELIESFDAGRRNEADVMFCRFIALWHLAHSLLLSSGQYNKLPDFTARYLWPFFTGTISYAYEAIKQVATINSQHPGYIDSLGNSAIGMVDRICLEIEQLHPGFVQQTLGYIKLIYLGRLRIGIAPEFEPSFELLSKIAKFKFTSEKTICSVIAISHSKSVFSGANGIRFKLFSSDFNEKETIRDDDMFGSVLLAEDGNIEYISGSIIDQLSNIKFGFYRIPSYEVLESALRTKTTP